MLATVIISTFLILLQNTSMVQKRAANILFEIKMTLVQEIHYAASALVIIMITS